MIAGRTKKDEWRKPGRRQGYRTLAPERHLVVCEGKQTEPLYFRGMRDALKPEFRNRVHIVVKGTGLHTTDLLDYAERECHLSGGFDHVWVAYDRDDFDRADFDAVARRCAEQSTGSVQFHALWSNPCVEVWLLLHFGFSTATLTSSEAASRLDAAFHRELGRPYAKNDERLFADLSNRLEAAESNAERLMCWHKEEGLLRPSEMNPGTTLPEITGMLKSYLDVRG